PLCLELLIRLDAESDLTAGRQQQHVGLAAWRIGQDVSALAEVLGRPVLRAVQGRHRLPRQDEAYRLVTPFYDKPPRLKYLVGVTRPQGDQSGDRSKRGEVLNRLVRWPVLAHGDGVVSEDVDDRNLHDCRQPQRVAAI